MNDSLLILLARDDDALREQVQNLSPRLEFVSREQLQKDPDLLARLDVVYGSLNADELARATKLRWLQSTSAGVNSLLTPEVRARDFVITTTSGIHAAPIAEQMFGMVLVVTRGLNLAWQAQQKREWGGFDFGASILSGKTLGILGVGAIGGHAARIGKAFGMTVVGLRHSRKAHPDVEQMYGEGERAAFFGRSDVVMNVLPLTDATRNFVGESEFSSFKRGAIFVNAGRGATVDTGALLNALNRGQVGAACLDVTEPEPLPPDHPLWTTPNVFITPHNGGGRPDYNKRADDIFLANLRCFLDGEQLENVVDKEEGY